MENITKAPPTAKGLTYADLLANIHPRPSLIPGIKYPITDRDQRLIDLSWNHAIRYMDRNQIKEDLLLTFMREEVERIRLEDLGYE